MEEDDEVGFREFFDAGDVVRLEGVFLPLRWVGGHGRIDEAFLVDGEEDGGVEAVMRGQDFREHRYGLLAAVFLIGGDEDDVFSFSRAFAAGVGEPCFVFGVSSRDEKE